MTHAAAPNEVYEAYIITRWHPTQTRDAFRADRSDSWTDWVRVQRTQASGGDTLIVYQSPDVAPDDYEVLTLRDARTFQKDATSHTWLGYEAVGNGGLYRRVMLTVVADADGYLGLPDPGKTQRLPLPSREAP